MVIARWSRIPKSFTKKVNANYSPEHDRGLLCSDPVLGIAWPVSANKALVSDKDRTHPVLSHLPRYFLYEPPANP
jgi:dTDP-4-dehydrorhamnose 3,5-epimerase